MHFPLSTGTIQYMKNATPALPLTANNRKVYRKGTKYVLPIALGPGPR